MNLALAILLWAAVATIPAWPLVGGVVALVAWDWCKTRKLS